MSTPSAMLTGKAYTVAQAARLAQTSPGNVRRWLLGYSAPGHRMRPVFAAKKKAEGEPLALSFLELAELIVVARYRNGSGRRIPLARLRAAHQFARERLGIEHPFASDRFRIEGGHILHDYEGANPGPGRIAIDVDGHDVLPVEFAETFAAFDYVDGLAGRWYPEGRDRPIVVDPDYAAGQPAILGRNVRVDSLKKRWDDGWTIDEIAEDFSIGADVIEAALRAITKAAA